MKMHSAIPLILIQSPFRVDYKSFGYEHDETTMLPIVRTLGQSKFWMAEFFVEKQMVLPTREMSLSLLREISLLENIPLNINKYSSSPVLCTCTLSPS